MMTSRTVAAVLAVVLGAGPGFPEDTLRFVGKKLLFRYESGLVVQGRYPSPTALEWEAQSGPAKGSRGIEKIHAVEVAPGVFFVSWLEAKGTTVSALTQSSMVGVLAVLLIGVLGSAHTQRRGSVESESADLCLHAHIWAGDAESVAESLAKGADPNARDAVGRPALLVASVVGDPGIVGLLLSARAEPDAPDSSSGATPLMQASSGGHSQIVKALLDAGADVNAKDSHGATALIWAAEQRQIAVAALLVEAGADPNVRSRDGRTALRQGCWRLAETRQLISNVYYTRKLRVGPDDELMRLLVEAGADR